MKKINKLLITGAAGLCGSVLYNGLIKKGYKIICCDKKITPSNAAKKIKLKVSNKIKKIDLKNLKSLLKITKGIDAAIHFGGIPRHSPKEDVYSKILENNISGTYNLFEACRINRVKRIIFASSAHVIGFHNRKNRIDEKCTLRPDSHYAVSKCFGEALASLYSDKYDIKTMSIRIGSVLPQPTDERFLSTICN